MDTLADFVGWMLASSIVSAFFDAVGAWFGRGAEWISIAIVALLSAYAAWKDRRKKKDSGE